MMTTVGREQMQPTWFVPVGQRRRELFRPVDATAVGDHDALFPRAAPEGHHWLDILAQPLCVTMRADRIDAARRAILHGPDDAEPHAAGHPAPRALATPRWAFAGLLAFDLPLTQRARGAASALRLPPPARAGQGKAPQERFVFIERIFLPILDKGEQFPGVI